MANTRPTGTPQTCDNCGHVSPNQGLHSLHTKKCALHLEMKQAREEKRREHRRVAQTEAMAQKKRDRARDDSGPPGSAAPCTAPEKPACPGPKLSFPAPVEFSGVDVARLDEVCARVEEGLLLESACDILMVDVRPFNEAMRLVACRDPRATDAHRTVAARVKQAEAAFERDLMMDLRSDDKDTVNGAKALADVLKTRFRKRNLQFQYNAAAFGEVLRHHVDAETYRRVLVDLCELDPHMTTLALDEKFGIGPAGDTGGS